MKQIILLPWFLLKLVVINLLFVKKIFFSLIDPYKYYFLSLIIVFFYSIFLAKYGLNTSQDIQKISKTSIVSFPQDSQIQLSQIEVVKGTNQLEQVKANLLDIYQNNPTHADTLKNLYLINKYQQNSAEAEFYLAQLKAFSPN